MNRVQVQVRLPVHDCHCLHDDLGGPGGRFKCEVVSRQQYDLYGIENDRSSTIPRMQYVVKTIRLRKLSLGEYGTIRDIVYLQIDAGCDSICGVAPWQVREPYKTSTLRAALPLFGPTRSPRQSLLVLFFAPFRVPVRHPGPPPPTVLVRHVPRGEALQVLCRARPEPLDDAHQPVAPRQETRFDGYELLAGHEAFGLVGPLRVMLALWREVGDLARELARVVCKPEETGQPGHWRTVGTRRCEGNRKQGAALRLCPKFQHRPGTGHVPTSRRLALRTWNWA